MTRLRKGPATETMEREYVYAEPPISITELADKHGLARSGVADKARIGKWYEKREEFRKRLSDKTREAMAEKWAEMQTTVYERLMFSGVKYLDQYDKALAEGEIKPSARDMIAIATMMKSLLEDMARKPSADPALVGPGGDEMDPDDPESARAVIEQVRALMAGGAGAGTDAASEGHAGSDAAEGTAGARQE